MPRRAAKAQEPFLRDMKILADHWQGVDPSTFGLSVAQVQRFSDEIDAAEQAAQHVRDLRAQLEQAQADKLLAFGTLRATFGGLAGIVDGLARSEGDPGVYTRARIRPPRRRSPLPRPKAPKGLKIAVRTNGQLLLTFGIEDKGRGNLMYEIRRRCEPLEGPPTPWQTVAITADRRLLDQDIPTGLRNISYQARALRTNGRAGPWSGAVVLPFGSIPPAGRMHEENKRPRTPGAAKGARSRPAA